MIKLFQSKPLYKFIVGLVITATLQFFAPLLNAASSDKCCESHQMQCCQEEFPSRMLCCIADAQKKIGNSVTTQGIPQKLKNMPDGLMPIFASCAGTLAIPIFEPIEYRFVKIPSFIENKIYKKLSIFLI